MSVVRYNVFLVDRAFVVRGSSVACIEVWEVSLWRFLSYLFIFSSSPLVFLSVEEPFLVESWNYSSQLYCAALVTIQLRKDSSRVGKCEEARRRYKILGFAGLHLDLWFCDALYRVCYCHYCSVIAQLDQANPHRLTSLVCPAFATHCSHGCVPAILR